MNGLFARGVFRVFEGEAHEYDDETRTGEEAENIDRLGAWSEVASGSCGGWEVRGRRLWAGCIKAKWAGRVVAMIKADPVSYPERVRRARLRVS